MVYPSRLRENLKAASSNRALEREEPEDYLARQKQTLGREPEDIE